MEEKNDERGGALSSDFPRLVFMGTPDFAVPSLQRLADASAPIVLVVTQPDRPKGRGKKLTAPPVKVLAEKLGLPVYQPERIKAQETLETLRSTQADCAVVVAYGQLLPQSLLDMFPHGVLNVHGSLLPRYRGAAPIQRSILSGDTATGVSIMLLDAGMDTGPVLAEREIPIHDEDTFRTLHDKLAEVGAELLRETLGAWWKGSIEPRTQENENATYAPPIRKEELHIAWRLPALQIANAMRAFDPLPGAYVLYQGKRVKCFRPLLLKWKAGGLPGEVVGQSEQGLLVLAGDGHVLAIGELQLEGQRRISAGEFLRGHPLPAGSRFE